MLRPQPHAPPAEPIVAGQAALDSVVDALRAAATRFGDVAPVLDLVLQTAGHVVVTGLGKSGHVGRKLAATLASTGTPAFFVHATEALHGDSGMVAADDLLLALSNSGATAEVVAFAGVVRARGVRVVAMTGCDGRSPLCRQADARIDVRVEREGDPFDLVPTASTVAASAVGDALAVALMVARGFGPQEFHRHHPGGSLGARLQDGEP